MHRFGCFLEVSRGKVYSFFMVSKIFLNVSLLGAEWVLYVLIGLSIFSIALIAERVWFYREATKNLDVFRQQLRQATSSQNWDQVKKTLEERKALQKDKAPDFEVGLVENILNLKSSSSNVSLEALHEASQDALLRTKLKWEKNLVLLATIGNNAPFIGLFGTVLGIIQAFHTLSQHSEGGVTTITAGISEALIATGFGIIVAIPAVIAFNLFQRKVKAAFSEAEALKSYMMGQLINKRN